VDRGRQANDNGLGGHDNEQDVETLTKLIEAVRRTIDEASGLRLSELHFAQNDEARLWLLALVGLSIAALLVRALMGGSSRGAKVGLPALLPQFSTSSASFTRHGAWLLALAGLPFFALALADPRLPLVRREMAYPGRRISLMIDASSSMLSALPSTRLARNAPNQAAFFTTVGAARYFIELRMKGQYRDLVSLIEFGDQAYVITPFTSDYENILLSTSLIGDWNEFMSFPDQGTIIANAIDQGVGLFKAFSFLEASGNVMVIFSDGVDAEVTEDGRSPFDVLRAAAANRIPVFFIRVGGGPDAQKAISDQAWYDAVARTGGRFFNATDEATIVRAIHEIDRAAEGRIETKQYSTEEPRFSIFALLAAACWSGALLLRVTMPQFRKFP
jgi:Ca-activated chloride channel family protein